MQVILQALIPVVVFVAAGFILRRAFNLDFHPVSRVALYVFSPALVLNAIIAPHLSFGALSKIVVFALIMLLGSMGVSRLIGWLFHQPRPSQSALDLTTVFSNSANLGLPLVAFSLGQSSLHAAIIFVLTQIVAVNTIGAYLAGRSGVDPRAAFHRMVRLPSLWAMMVAIILLVLHVHLPSGVATAARFGSQAYAPTVLVVLGSTLADWQHSQFRQFLPWFSTAARLIVMPLISVGVVTVLSLSTPVARALVLQIAMPVAVNALILAREFDAAPEEVGQTITLSTLGGIVTIPIWLAFMPAIHG